MLVIQLHCIKKAHDRITDRELLRRVQSPLPDDLHSRSKEQSSSPRLFCLLLILVQDLVRID